MSVVNDITVVGTSLRGRCAVFPSGQCNLLPLGLVVVKQGETMTLRVDRIGEHIGRSITISEVIEFPAAFASMVDHLSIISAEVKMEGKLHWRSSVGNSLAKYRLNGYMLITPQFYKCRWDSMESLRAALGYSYPEEILPFWGRPDTAPTTDREAGQRYFSEAIEYLLETYTRRELSRQTDIPDQIISRLRYHGNMSHELYSYLAPTLEQHGFDLTEAEHHLVLALGTKKTVATADQQTCTTNTLAEHHAAI